ncbi:cytochrome P450 [Streptomyces sp. NPDC001508]|uniref:cytochrome P450 n=1 Tax=Streptomyces sp. NPDC001508 TaxID=3154656 RepID=UPI003330A79A
MPPSEPTHPTETVDESFAVHPHDVYRRWRDEGGVRRVRFPGPVPLAGWVVTGHAACRAALADPRLSKDGATEVFARYAGLPTDGPGGSLTTHMLNSDPPRHTRLRRIVQQAFTTRRVADLRPRIEARVTALLDALDGADQDEVRHESPFGIATLRYTTEPVTIAGTAIPAGEFVQIALSAANRDPDVFGAPDRFDITRDASRHLAFGHGIHHCLGAPLARLQAGIAFGHILRRFPGLRHAYPHRAPQWQNNPRHRGLLTLPVRLR